MKEKKQHEEEEGEEVVKEAKKNFSVAGALMKNEERIYGMSVPVPACEFETRKKWKNFH